ncbi:nicotinamide N-methyltransferase-like [Rhinophrynus dorsalis]
MAAKQHKHYHDAEYDAVAFLQTYIGTGEGPLVEEHLENPLKFIFKVLYSGAVKGDTLIDLTHSIALFHLMVATDYFKEITILESNDTCIREINMWLNNEEETIDWSHAAMFACALKGERTDPETQGFDTDLRMKNQILRVGGYLIMASVLNMSYYTIGQNKYFILKCDDEFVRKALLDTGFIIESYEKIESKLNTHLLDHEHIHLLVARKARE